MFTCLILGLLLATSLHSISLQIHELPLWICPNRVTLLLNILEPSSSLPLCLPHVMGCKFVNVHIEVHHKTVHVFLIDLQFILDCISQSVNNHNIGRNYQKRPLGAIDHVKMGLTRCSFCRGKAGCTTNHYGRTLPSSPSSLTPWMWLQLQECVRASSHVADGYWWGVLTGTDLQTMQHRETESNDTSSDPSHDLHKASTYQIL